MSYKTYTTQALVFGTFDYNTSDRTFLLLTEMSGMIYATARSVRKEKSRQRSALQDFSLIKVSLIKGKYNWRIGSVETEGNYYQRSVNRESRINVVNVFRLVKRLVSGSEPMVGFFSIVTKSLDELSRAEIKHEFLWKIIQIRILSYLGYVDDSKVPKQLLTGSLLESSNLLCSEMSKEIDKICIQGTTVSHL